MSFFRDSRRGALAAVAICLAFGTAASAREKLSEFDFILLGLSVRPEPELQVVPRNTATGLHVVVDFQNALQSFDVGSQNWMVAATNGDIERR